MTESYKGPSVAHKVEALLNTLYKVAVGWQPAVAAQLAANADLLDELLPKLAPVNTVEGEEVPYTPPERIVLDMAIQADRDRFQQLGGDPDNPGTGPLLLREQDVPQAVEAPTDGPLPKRPGTPPAVQKRGLSSDATRRRQVAFIDQLQLISASTKTKAYVLSPLRVRACTLFKSRFVAKLRIGTGQTVAHNRIVALVRVIIDPPPRPPYKPEPPEPPAAPEPDDSAAEGGGEVVYGHFQ